jgi:hypothetical protein
MPIDPVAGLTIVNGVADATKKLYAVIKGLKDHEAKQKLDEILDELRELKRQASELEDQNRSLREKLRFKSDEYEFKSPFWYEKTHPDQPLCAKCFTDQKIAHVKVDHDEDGDTYGRCLHCEAYVRVQQSRRYSPGPYGGSGSDDWMG